MCADSGPYGTHINHILTTLGIFKGQAPKMLEQIDVGKTVQDCDLIMRHPVARAYTDVVYIFECAIYFLSHLCVSLSLPIITTLPFPLYLTFAQFIHLSNIFFGCTHTYQKDQNCVSCTDTFCGCACMYVYSSKFSDSE